MLSLFLFRLFWHTNWEGWRERRESRLIERNYVDQRSQLYGTVCLDHKDAVPMFALVLILEDIGGRKISATENGLNVVVFCINGIYMAG